MRSTLVERRAPDMQPSQRLRDLCAEYRVASDALSIAADLGCSGDLYDALFDLCRREAAAYETRSAGGLA
jgi:hypothetical protein